MKILKKLFMLIASLALIVGISGLFCVDAKANDVKVIIKPSMPKDNKSNIITDGLGESSVTSTTDARYTYYLLQYGDVNAPTYSLLQWNSSQSKWEISPSYSSTDMESIIPDEATISSLFSNTDTIYSVEINATKKAAITYDTSFTLTGDITGGDMIQGNDTLAVSFESSDSNKDCHVYIDGTPKDIAVDETAYIIPNQEFGYECSFESGEGKLLLKSVYSIEYKYKDKNGTTQDFSTSAANRACYGDSVNAPDDGIAGGTVVGWYSDEALTNPINYFDASGDDHEFVFWAKIEWDSTNDITLKYSYTQSPQWTSTPSPFPSFIEAGKTVGIEVQDIGANAIIYVVDNSGGASLFGGDKVTLQLAQGRDYKISFENNNYRVIFAKKLNINYKDAGGGAYSGQKLAELQNKVYYYGDLPELVSNDTKGDTPLVGWYLDSACKNPVNTHTPITADTTFYAKWKTNSDYTFKHTSSNGWDPTDVDIINGNKSIRIVNEGSIVKITVDGQQKAEVRNGNEYTVDSNCLDAKKKYYVFRDSLELKFLSEISIEYLESDGSPYVGDNSEKLTKSGYYSMEFSPIPGERAGYKFLGWYLDKDFSREVKSKIYLTTNPTVFYAKWQKNNSASHKFVDVNYDSWMGPGITFVDENGIMKGIGDDKFDPKQNCSREMMIQITFNFLNPTDEVNFENPFKDISKENWSYKAVVWGVKYGLTAGISKDEFGRTKELSREEVAQFLYNLDKVKANLNNANATEAPKYEEFKDTDKVSGWAKEAMKWAVDNGIMSGKGEGILDPKATATRAEVATMVMHYVEYTKK